MLNLSLTWKRFWVFGESNPRSSNAGRMLSLYLRVTPRYNAIGVCIRVWFFLLYNSTLSFSSVFLITPSVTISIFFYTQIIYKISFLCSFYHSKSSSLLFFSSPILFTFLYLPFPPFILFSKSREWKYYVISETKYGVLIFIRKYQRNVKCKSFSYSNCSSSFYFSFLFQLQQWQKQ